MARTDLTVQSSGRLTVLTNPTQNAADSANGNSFDNTGINVILYVNNGSGGNVDLTVDIPDTFEGEERPNKTYTLADGSRTVIGPFNTTYNQTDNSLTNRVLLDWDIDTSVTVEVIACPNANDGI